MRHVGYAALVFLLATPAWAQTLPMEAVLAGPPETSISDFRSQISDQLLMVE